MNDVSGIKQRIDNFNVLGDIDNDTLVSVISESAGLSEDKDKEAVYAALTEKVRNILEKGRSDGSIGETEDKDKIANYRDMLKTNGGFTDVQIDDLFRNHNLVEREDTNDDVDSIKKNIDNIKELSDINSNVLAPIFMSVAALSENEDKDAVWKYLNEKVLGILQINLADKSINDADKKDIQDVVSSYRNSLKINGGFTDAQIDDLFTNYNLTESQGKTDDPLEDLTQEQIDEEIARLEAELADVFAAAEAANMTPRDYLNSEIKRIEEEKANQVKQINDEIDRVKEFTNYDDVAVQNQIETYQEQERQLLGNGVEEDNNDVVEIRENIQRLVKIKIDNEKYIEDSIQEEIETYQEQERQLLGNGVEENNSDVIEIRKKISELEEIKNDNANIDNIRKEIADLEKLSSASTNSNSDEQYSNLTDEQIQQQIERLNVEKEQLENQLKGLDNDSDLTEDQKQIKAKIDELREEQADYYYYGSTLEDKKKYEEYNEEIEKLESQLKNLSDNVQSNDLTDEQKQIKAKIDELREEQADYYYYGSTLEDKKKYEEYNEEIEKLESQLRNLSNNVQSNDLTEEQKQIKAKIDEKNQEIENLSTVLEGRKNNNLTDEQKKRLEELKSKLAAVEKKRTEIKNNANAKIKELEEKQKNIQSEADKKVEDLKGKLSKLDRLEKLKKLKKTKGHGSEKRYDLMYKALAGLAGFGLGFGMAMVPGVGTIRMGIAVAKLVTSAINTYSKRHPEGKIAKIMDTHRDKSEERQAAFRENHPNISSAIDKVREIMKSPYTKWFTNGVAVGYIAGNIYEGIKAATKKPTPKPGNSTPNNSTPAPNSTPTPIGPTPPPNPTPTPVTAPVDPGLEIGEKFNETLEYGFRGIDGHGYTHLIDVGPGKTIERIMQNPSTGEYWARVIQPNGVDLAWVKAQDLADTVGQAIVDGNGKVVAEPLIKAAGKTF